MLYLLIFGNFLNPRGLGRSRTLRYAWLYPRQSQASLEGYYGGNPRTSPNVFSKNFCIQVSRILRKVDARHKRLRNGIGRAMGPPTPPGYSIPTHLPMPKPFVNANFLAETYLRCIREHGSKVEKMKARTHRASMGHTIDIYINKFLNPKVRSRQSTNLFTWAPRSRFPTGCLPPPRRIFNSVEISYRGDVIFKLLG